MISEDDIIPFDKFKFIFDQEMTSSSFKNLMHDRLQWYYQQLLKISFVLDFVSKKNQKIVIWDADTIILKKIKFFKNDLSVKYGTVFEFHKPYYNTNEVFFTVGGKETNTSSITTRNSIRHFKGKVKDCKGLSRSKEQTVRINHLTNFYRPSK